jgi:FHA domain/Cytochrome c3
MTATIRMITRRASGRESTRATEVAKNQLSIGRATDCDIHLPDLRIGLKHARLTISDGTFLIEAEGDNEFKVNGRSVRRIEARLGGPLEAHFGPYVLKFSEAAGRLVIDVERVQQASAAQHSHADQVFSLRHTWLSKRVAAWGFALLVAALFIIFPIATFATRSQAVPAAMRQQAGQMWISGELSGPHEMLAKDCAACHEAAFVSVRDETCLSCHDDINNHADHARMTRARGTLSVSEKSLRTVADTFNKPAGRCAECHMEHNGHEGLAPVGQTSCTSCHNKMTARLPDATVGDASDFGRDHPEFRPTVVASADLRAPKLTREWTIADLERARTAREKAVRSPARAAVTCDGFALGQPNFRGLQHAGALPGEAMAGDNSGLVFPHDVHLQERGCVAAIAQRLKADEGYGDKLVCKDCHTENDDGVGFRPVSMERNCSACHSLVFDNVGGFERELRHGRTNDVIATLLDFYQARVVGAALGGGGGEDRRRPGEAAQRSAGFRATAFAQAPARAASRVRAIFSEGGACYGCHVVTPPTQAGSLDFKVQPVTLRDTFLPKAAFAHRAHETGDLECEDCHEARTSKSSTDVLLPPVASCQACHGGEHATANVQSSCVLCHGFHSTDDGAAPMTPAGARKKSVR